MKCSMDNKEIILKMMNDILRTLKQGEYFRCVKLCEPLINLSWYLNSKQDTFMGEVLQSSLYDINMTLNQEPTEKVLSSTSQKNVTNKMTELFQKVLVAYQENNIEQLYDSLQNIRFQATYYQLNTERFGDTND